MYGVDFAVVMHLRGFRRVKTRYDSDAFFRMTKHDVFEDSPLFKQVLDVFIGEPRFRTVRGGWRVVEPELLLSFYTKGYHGSGECFAVQAAKKLIRKGEDVANRSELAELLVVSQGK